ncbi:hypothetical protein D3C77_210580 [compost metagenome]
MNNMREERNLSALAEVRNIVAQEIYKISVIKQYPEEYLRIVELYISISNKFSSAGFSEESENTYLYKRALVNHVVEERGASEWSEYLFPLIKEIAEDNYETKNETIVALKGISSEIFMEYKEFNTVIPHKYPPELLLEWIEYVELYGFYHQENYGIKRRREKVKDNLSFCEAGNYMTVISTHPVPINIIKPYSHGPFFEIYSSTEKLKIPLDAVSKDSNKIQFDISDPLDSKKLDIKLMMEQAEDIDEVEIITDLNLSINLRDPISPNDLEIVIAALRAHASFAQYKNSNSHKILASTPEEINHAFGYETLPVPSYGERQLLSSAKEPKVLTFKEALNLLSGLCLLQKTSLRSNNKSGIHYFTWNKRKHTNINTEADLLAIYLNDRFKSGENEKNEPYVTKSDRIKKGYVKIIEHMSHHIDSFQKKRVQFNVTLNAQQRLALKNAPSVTLDELHPDDIELAEKKLISHQKQGRNASIKLRKNGSFVITW